MRDGKPLSFEILNLQAILASVLDLETPVASVLDLALSARSQHPAKSLPPTYTSCPATEVIETLIRSALDEAGNHKISLET